VNLLVHADYAETDASLIVRSPDGYFFRNPGSSRVSEFDLLAGDRSDPRNPELVRMFRYIGLAEEAGSGMPKIIRAWRELGFVLPDIDVGTDAMSSGSRCVTRI
jgi:ATP-dependent DNA helicase RecG